MSNLGRHRTIVFFIDALIALVCVLGVYHVSQKAGIPVVFDQRDGRVWCVDVLDPAYEQYIKPGEIVRAVGNVQVQRMEDVEFLLDARRIGEVVEFEIEHNGVHRSAAIPLSRYYQDSYFVTASFVGLLFFLIGLFVY